MAGMKIRAKEKGGVTQVKALISHPMETGLRKDKQGNEIPEHFIKEVTVKQGERTLLVAEWGTAVSKNPYLAFRFKGASKGDTLTMSWVDNRGDSDSLDAEIK